MSISTKQSDYRDKNKIINLFTNSIDRFNKFLSRATDDESFPTLEILNEAGLKLYQCFEAALKRTLVIHKEQTLKKRGVNLRLIKSEIKKIEGFDRPTLVNELKSIGVIPAKSNIDFDIINKNAYVVTNGYKHKLANSDKQNFIITEPHIREFIISYVDDKADLPIINDSIITFSVANELFDEANYFSKTGQWNYMLLVDSTQGLTESHRQALCYIKWSMVLDFDIDSANNGLMASFVNLVSKQPEQLNPNNPVDTEFDSYSDAPYWFYINGQAGLNNTIANDERAWNQKYGHKLYDIFLAYHQTLSKNVKVVILSTDTKKVQKICEALDSVYEERVKFLLLCANHPEVKRSYNCLTFPMSDDEFARSINANSSKFEKSYASSDCMMPDKDGQLNSINKKEYTHLELVHQNIAEEDEKDGIGLDPEPFYQGRTHLSWFGARNQFAVARNQAVTKLKRFIKDSDSTSNFHEITCEAGIGGSTFVRDFAYQLRGDYPCCILQQYIKDKTANQLFNLYNELRSQIIIFADSGQISNEQIIWLKNELKPMAFPFIILYTKRKRDSKSADLTYLNDYECDEMKKRLDKYSSDSAKSILGKICSAKSKDKDRSPFYMSLYTFEKDFHGIAPYIETFIESMKPEQERIILFLAIADIYANSPLYESFFKKPLIASDDTVDTFWGKNDDTFDHLVVYEDQGNFRCYRIRHPLFADEIIRKLLFTDRSGAKISDDACASNESPLN